MFYGLFCWLECIIPVYLDCRSGKCIQVIDPKKDKKLEESFPRVSCIALDASESWLVSSYTQVLIFFFSIKKKKYHALLWNGFEVVMF